MGGVADQHPARPAPPRRAADDQRPGGALGAEARARRPRRRRLRRARPRTQPAPSPAAHRRVRPAATRPARTNARPRVDRTAAAPGRRASGTTGARRGDAAASRPAARRSPSGRSRCARSRRRARAALAAPRPSQWATSVASTSASSASRAARSRAPLSSSCSSAAASVMTASAPTRCSQAENSRWPDDASPRTTMSWTGVVAPAPRCVPDLEALEQIDRGGVERVGTDVLARGRSRRAAQRHREAEARERQRQALADDPRTAHLHVEALHRGDCRERCRRQSPLAAPLRRRIPTRRSAIATDLDVTLESIHVYPVKSCAGSAPREALLTETGLDLDRQWLVVDPAGVLRDAARAAAHGARADDAEVERADPARARHARRARRHRSGRGAHRGRGLGRPRRRLRHGRPVRAVVQRFPRPPAPAGALRSRGAAPRRPQVDGCRRRRQCLSGRLPAPGRLGHVDRRSEPASRQRRPGAGHARPLPPEPRPRRPRCQRRGSSRRDRLRRRGGAGAAQARQAVRPLLDPRRRSRHRRPPAMRSATCCPTTAPTRAWTGRSRSP